MRCVYPSCDNTVRTRGLCHGHYQAARARIRENKITEYELMERGLMLDKGEGKPIPVQLHGFDPTSCIVGRLHPRYSFPDATMTDRPEWGCLDCIRMDHWCCVEHKELKR